MKYFIALVIIFMVVSVMAGTIRLGGDKTIFFKFETTSDPSPPPESGFLLLESSGDKLLLESGTTDALLLEG
jgi:hypothetical protein